MFVKSKHARNVARHARDQGFTKTTAQYLGLPLNMRPVILGLKIVAAFIIAFFAGFGIAHAMNLYTLAENTGGANRITAKENQATPYVSDIEGEYYLLSVHERRTLLDAVYESTPLPDIAFNEEMREPSNPTLTFNPDGRWETRMPEQWVSSMFSYYLSYNLSHFGTFHTPPTNPSEPNLTPVSLTNGNTATRPNQEPELSNVNKETFVKKTFPNSIPQLQQGEAFHEEVEPVHKDIGAAPDNMVDVFIEPTPYQKTPPKTSPTITLPTHIYQFITPTSHRPLPQPIVPVNMTGRSADLMYFLYYTDAQESGDLTAGRTIGGTGSLTFNGFVSPIGGITSKLDAYLRKAQPNPNGGVFFYPHQHREEIENHLKTLTAPLGNIQLIPVEKATDPITWLCRNGGEGAVCTKDFTTTAHPSPPTNPAPGVNNPTVE